MILSSKTALISKGDKIYGIGKDVEDWLITADRKGGDCRLVMRLETVGNNRHGKKSLASELESLAVDAALEDKDVWECWGYKFCFLSKLYYWKGKQVYLTAGEALFLFCKLVEGCRDYNRTQNFYLRNMRKRLGKDFLTEVF